MIDHQHPLLDPDVTMTNFIRYHSWRNPLDGDERQNMNGQTVIDRHQQELAKFYAKRSYYQSRRGHA